MVRKGSIVVDMLKDFIEEKGALFCGNECRKIAPFVVDTVERMRNEGSTIIFLGDCHDKDDKEFQLFPPHCICDTEGAELIEELAVMPGDYFVNKTRYSGFYGSNLDEIATSERLKRGLSRWGLHLYLRDGNRGRFKKQRLSYLCISQGSGRL